MKILFFTIVTIGLLGSIYFVTNLTTDTTEPASYSSGMDPLNATYLVEQASFTLIDGLAEKETAPGSASKNSLTVFGEPSFGDIDSDGDEDAVLILVNQPGGSGTFYYAAISVNVDGIYKGTDAISLGDRISPQNFYVEGNKAIVNYVKRNFGEAFSVEPSVAESLYITVNPENFQLIQIAHDFEGEANPDVMTLDMQSWKWIKTDYNDGTVITPHKTDAFTLSFNENNSVSIATDCNSMNSTYEVSDHQITFGPIISTKMFCPDSQEQEFSMMLSEADSFLFTSKGELIFNLKSGRGSVIFR